MKLLESHSYLSSEEIELKRELHSEECIQKFFEFYDEFSQKRTKLDLDVFDHYQELRFQIDQHREELKEKSDEIGEIALAMIDQTKKYEALYLRNIKVEKMLKLKIFLFLYFFYYLKAHAPILVTPYINPCSQQ
jgi:hypothetical protein